MRVVGGWKTANTQVGVRGVRWRRPPRRIGEATARGASARSQLANWTSARPIHGPGRKLEERATSALYGGERPLPASKRDKAVRRRTAKTRGSSPQRKMSHFGPKRAFAATQSNVRFWANSGHRPEQFCADEATLFSKDFLRSGVAAREVERQSRSSVTCHYANADSHASVIC